VVRANEKPEELLIPTGCVWDAYMFVCGLIRSAEKRKRNLSRKAEG